MRPIFISAPITLLLTLFLGGCWHGPAQPPTIPTNGDGSDITASTTASSTETLRYDIAEMRDLSTWQIYEDREIGFKFRYPRGWFIEIDEQSTSELTQLRLRPTEKFRKQTNFAVSYIIIPYRGERVESDAGCDSRSIFDVAKDLEYDQYCERHNNDYTVNYTIDFGSGIEQGNGLEAYGVSYSKYIEKIEQKMTLSVLTNELAYASSDHFLQKAFSASPIGELNENIIFILKQIIESFLELS